MNLLQVGNERQTAASAARGFPGLDWLNFFIANFQTGFGPFISVYLTSAGWTQTAIGAALSTGTIASMASQVPAGVLVDAVRNKRMAATIAIAVIGVSALAIALAKEWSTSAALIARKLGHNAIASALTPMAAIAVATAVRLLRIASTSAPAGT